MASAAPPDVTALVPHPDSLPGTLLPDVAAASAAKNLAGVLALAQFVHPAAWDALSALPPADDGVAARVAAAADHAAALRGEDAGKETSAAMLFRLVDPAAEVSSRLGVAVGVIPNSKQPLVARMMDRLPLLEGGPVKTHLVSPTGGDVYSLPLQAPQLIAEAVLKATTRGAQ